MNGWSAVRHVPFAAGRCRLTSSCSQLSLLYLYNYLLPDRLNLRHAHHRSLKPYSNSTSWPADCMLRQSLIQSALNASYVRSSSATPEGNGRASCPIAHHISCAFPKPKICHSVTAISYSSSQLPLWAEQALKAPHASTHCELCPIFVSLVANLNPVCWYSSAVQKPKSSPNLKLNLPMRCPAIDLLSLVTWKQLQLTSGLKLDL